MHDNNEPSGAESGRSVIDLFSPVQLGPYTLANRIVMAPMTRNRATTDFVPSAISETYYAQRASAGLVVTEASQVSPQGAGYPRTPGIYNPKQIAAWRRITEAIHDRGGRVFLQLWHAGRISHRSVQPGNDDPVAPCSLRANGQLMTSDGMQDYSLPRALRTDEMPKLVEQFRQGAKNALEAGFDGVELHAANGYLLDQFIRDGFNLRTDAYGGSLDNRLRLLLEVTAAVTDVWGADRVGVRISPLVDIHSVYDSDPQTTFCYIGEKLSSFGLAYLHVFESIVAHPNHTTAAFKLADLRRTFAGTYIANGGYALSSANEAVARDQADLVSFAALYLANPDLVERFKTNAALNAADPETFYQGDEKGYTDYPSLRPGRKP